MQALKFLVVDDASFIRDMMKKQLRDAYPGCLIMDAPNVAKAQVALKAQRFDLILCDWEMPGMSGEEFLRWLRAHPQHAELPFIMVSSRGERDFIVKAVQAGVSDYIGKPFKPELLVAKVNKVLTRAGIDVSQATRFTGTTQGIAGASVAVLTGAAGRAAPAPAPSSEPAPAAAFAAPKPAPRPQPAKAVARGQAQLNFATFNAQCVIKDISLQMMSGVIKREQQLPVILEPVVISIFETGGDDVARLNGYVHAIQAAENRIDASVLKLVIRFVDDDPAKLDLLSRYIAKL